MPCAAAKKRSSSAHSRSPSATKVAATNGPNTPPSALRPTKAVQRPPQPRPPSPQAHRLLARSPPTHLPLPAPDTCLHAPRHRRLPVRSRPATPLPRQAARPLRATLLPRRVARLLGALPSHRRRRMRRFRSSPVFVRCTPSSPRRRASFRLRRGISSKSLTGVTKTGGVAS